jgi:hypothetical protein
MHYLEADLRFARLEGASQLAQSTQCDKHLFEEASGMCRACRRPFCTDCLVYAQGPNKAPYCIPCALTAAGVRSTAATQAKRGRRGLAGRLLGGIAATAAAVMIAIPALSGAIH